MSERLEPLNERYRDCSLIITSDLHSEGTILLVYLSEARSKSYTQFRPDLWY